MQTSMHLNSHPGGGSRGAGPPASCWRLQQWPLKLEAVQGRLRGSGAAARVGSTATAPAASVAPSQLRSNGYERGAGRPGARQTKLVGRPSSAATPQLCCSSG